MQHDNQERLRKQAALREHLERLPGTALLNASMAAIYLDVSTKTLGRWREVKGLGPPFLQPVVQEGVARTTQPYKYRKSDLELFVSSRMNSGGFAFASRVQPWLLNEAGSIVGNALDRLSIDELLESHSMAAPLLDALSEPWESAGAMRPYRDELERAMKRALDQVDSDVLTLQLEERTPAATGKRRERDL